MPWLNVTNRTGKGLSIPPSSPVKATAKRERRHCDVIRFRATTDEQHNLVITADRLWRMFKERIQEGNQLQAYSGALVCVAPLFFSGSPTDRFNTLVSERFT